MKALVASDQRSTRLSATARVEVACSDGESVLCTRFASSDIGMTEELASRTARLVHSFEKSDATTGIVLLSNNGNILWENGVHIRSFGNGVGEFCYRFYNRFLDKCKWCRLPEVIAKHCIQTARAVSPDKTHTRPVYSDLIFIPLALDTTKPAAYVLEVIVYRTTMEQRRSTLTIDNHNALARIATTIQCAETDDDVYDLLLIGTLICLDFNVRAS
jgi:hypothetical protein